MTPDPRHKRGLKKKRPLNKNEIKSRTRPSSNDPHEIVFFQRHEDDDPNKSVPAEDFLRSKCPESVKDNLRAVLVAVAKAPPKSFPGGGKWEVMHDNMKGWYEARADGPARTHYRLFCRLDYDAPGETKPLLVVVTGMKKPFMTEFTDTDYAKVRALGAEYFAHRSD